MNDAGTAFVEIKPELRGFGRDLGRGIDPHVDRSAKNVESKFGGAFKGAALAAGGAFAALGAGAALKGIVSGASDLNETISKSNTIFGANAKEIENWAGTAAKSIGQSKQGALDAAATFGNLFVQLGTGSGEAAKMSKEMVGLASDFASFHNADPTDVINAMTAAFRGEYDAVQRYVPTINAAAVEQKALKMGLAATTKELTAQDKALATQKLLYEGAGDAMGDFARTSDGLANKQRILSAQFQDAKDKIGTALLPVVLKLLEGFLSLGSAISGPVKQAFGVVKEAWDAVLGGFQNADAGIGPSVSSFEEAFLRIGAAGAKAVEWFKANWPQIRKTAGEVVDWIIANVLPRAQEVAAFFIGKFGEVVTWVKANWPAISEAVRHVVNVVRELFERLAPVVARMWDEMKTKIDIVINVILGIITTVLNIINGEWGRVWDGIKNLLASAWDGMVSIVRGGVASIVNAFLRMVEIVLEGGARMFGWVPGIGEKLREARDAFGEFKDSVNRSLRGIEDKTVTLYLTKSGQEYGPDRPGAGFATGGQVPGQGDGDIVPAWLTPGEFVIRKKAVQALGVPYLEQLNAQGYASGGLVDFNWHLPSVGGITSAAQSMFDDMAATAAASAQKAYEAEAAAAAAKRGPAGGDVGGGDYVGTTWQGITAALDRRGMDYTVTSAYRPGDPGFHGRGKAVDLVGDMANIFRTIASFSGINELFYDPIGWYLDEGNRHSGAIGGHDDHVHAATFHAGGIVPGQLGQDRLAVVEAGERITPVGADSIDYDKLGAAVAKALAAHPPQISAYALSKGLSDARRR